MSVDRRTFLGGSAALALAIGGGTLLGGGAPAGGAAAGPLTIGGGDHLLVGPHTLDYRSGFQSFAWSPLSRLFFYAQPAPGSSAHAGVLKAKHYGDLLVSTLTTQGGTTSSHMQLNGFGHGGSLGVEISSGKHNYLWIDTSAKVGSGDADPRAICCFRYTGKGAYTPHDLTNSKKMPHAQRYVLKDAAHQSVTYDQSTHRIALRYQVSSGYYYAIYDVAALRRTGGRTKPVHDAIPARAVEAGGTGSFQSFALWGDWLYALRGTKSKNNATLHAYNVRTGHATHAALHAAPAGRTGREPEGLCVYTGGSTPRLAVGIKNDAKHGTTSQTGAIYLKP